jgi:hypothetical protein
MTSLVGRNWEEKHYTTIKNTIKGESSSEYAGHIIRCNKKAVS